MNNRVLPCHGYFLRIVCRWLPADGSVTTEMLAEGVAGPMGTVSQGVSLILGHWPVIVAGRGREAAPPFN